MFNKYFASQMDLEDNNRPVPHIPPTEHTLTSNVITVEDVKNVLRNLDINIACGPDLVSPRLLKEDATIIALSLSLLEARIFSHRLQVSKRYPYLQDRPSNYGTITLLSTLYKWRHRYVKTMTPLVFQRATVHFFTLPMGWYGLCEINITHH